jgi:hypothetical protein
MIKKLLVGLVFVTLLFITCFLYLNYSHWSSRDINDNSKRPLKSNVNTLKQALLYANEVAYDWNNEAWLTDINVSFNGKKLIKERKGKIEFSYYAKNKSILGNSGAICRIVIDMEEHALTNFSTYGGDRLYRDSIETSKWNMDIRDAFSIVEKKYGNSFLYKFDDPKVMIVAYEKAWYFSLDNNASPEPFIDTEIVIDPQKGEIDDVKRFNGK